MANFDPEVEKVRAAVRNVEQIQKDLKALESRLAAGSSGASVLIRPCVILLERLLEAQAGVERLIEQLTHAEAA